MRCLKLGILKKTLSMLCGTSIEEDHVLINGQGVFGYFHGLQSSPIGIEITHPESWLAGTAMSKTESGMYYAYL